MLIPDLVLKGRIGNIGPILDPNLRTAKVRLEVQNPGMLRLGMFATATFYGPKKEAHATVPATAILHLHDRNWVYVPVGRRPVPARGSCGRQDDSGHARAQLQEIISGLQPGSAGGR